MAHDAGQHCHCVSEHRPRIDELDRHHVRPLSWGGPDVKSNIIWLCPNAHRQVHLLLSLYKKHQGAVTREMKKDFSRFTQALAQRGWDAHQQAKAA